MSDFRKTLLIRSLQSLDSVLWQSRVQVNSRWVCLWFGPGNLFFQARDFFCRKAVLPEKRGERFWKNLPVTAGYSRRAVEGSEFGVPVELCPGLYKVGKVVVGKLHAHRWAPSCLLASKWPLLPRLCHLSSGLALALGPVGGVGARKLGDKDREI